ncbi:ABC transporter substrate-binding protein [Microbacterium sp. PA5]|uniref:ABC transporter substrate-binding protein n=1 Tax=Microbacterium sp. PA5 TaxID=3416654 RepID=UPI003CF9DF81
MSQSRTHRSTTAAGALLAVAALALTACAPPGSGTTSPTSSAPAGGAEATCGEEDVVLSAYIETGFALPKELFDEFTAQYPNVTFDVREDQFAVLTQNAPRVLQDDPPDLMRLPQMSELASGGLLLDLDPYAEQFGWVDWPESQLAQLRVDEEGRRGSGPLWAMGLNFSMTGVFYNKELAAEIGMTEAPKTIDELDAVLAAAKEAGITPIAQFNGGATGGLLFPLQALMASYGPTAPINDWIFHTEGATIDTAENLAAAEHLQRWVEAGYFADDVNSLDYSQMMSRFIGGESLLIFNGDWESGNLDSQMAGKAGFFLMPPLEEGGTQFGAMSAPLTYGIAAGAEHPDCAAFFLNWVATDEKARTITVEVGGSHPMGPADAFMPEVAADSVTAATLAAGTQVNEVNGAMDFLANATGSIYAQSWTPNIQQLVAGQQDAQGMLTAVEADYQAEVGG